MTATDHEATETNKVLKRSVTHSPSPYAIGIKMTGITLTPSKLLNYYPDISNTHMPLLDFIMKRQVSP